MKKWNEFEHTEEYPWNYLDTFSSRDIFRLLIKEITKIGVELNIPWIKELLNQCNPNQQDRSGNTALMIAASWGLTQVVQELLSHPDIDPNIQDRDGKTALILATVHGQLRTQTVRELLKHPKINPNLQDELGWTALINAAKWGSTQAVQELLSHPAIDITLTNNDGEDAWDLARHEIREQFPELKPNGQ